MSGWDGNWFFCRVPLEQMVDVWGKRNYLMSSTMIPLNYLMEVTFECGSGDTDVAAFTRAASIFGARNAAEEFFACSMWPLSEKFGFKVDRRETPYRRL
jgi:hypothetical protein